VKTIKHYIFSKVLYYIYIGFCCLSQLMVNWSHGVSGQLVAPPVDQALSHVTGTVQLTVEIHRLRQRHRTAQWPSALVGNITISLS